MQIRTPAQKKHSHAEYIGCSRRMFERRHARARQVGQVQVHLAVLPMLPRAMSSWEAKEAAWENKGREARWHDLEPESDDEALEPEAAGQQLFDYLVHLNQCGATVTAKVFALWRTWLPRPGLWVQFGTCPRMPNPPAETSRNALIESCGQRMIKVTCTTFAFQDTPSSMSDVPSWISRLSQRMRRCTASSWIRRGS